MEQKSDLSRLSLLLQHLCGRESIGFTAGAVQVYPTVGRKPSSFDVREAPLQPWLRLPPQQKRCLSRYEELVVESGSRPPGNIKILISGLTQDLIARTHQLMWHYRLGRGEEGRWWGGGLVGRAGDGGGEEGWW